MSSKSFTRLAADVTQLNQKQLKELRSLVDALLAEPGAVEVQEGDDGLVVRRVGAVSIHTEYRRCGRPGCKCAKGKRHGPYLYAHWREGGRHRSRYLGKA